MKLFINNSDLDANPALFLRDAGYTYIESRHTGQGSYARPIGGGNYPRLHVYIEEHPNQVVFNLHLDQKQASYEGVTAHSGEYDGPLVEQEVARLKGRAKPGSGGSRKTAPSPSSGDPRADRWSSMLRNM